MKQWANFCIWAIRAFCAFIAINTVILFYGILQQQPAAQITAMFILLVAGFGTDHWRKRKINAKIQNPYKQN